MDVRPVVKGFIEEHFLYRKEEKDISNDESLLDSGFIDSMGIFELISFLEKEFNVDISDGEVIPENFETINNIMALINKKRK